VLIRTPHTIARTVAVGLDCTSEQERVSMLLLDLIPVASVVATNSSNCTFALDVAWRAMLMSRARSRCLTFQPHLYPHSPSATNLSNSLTLASNILFSLCTLAASVCQNATSSLSRACAIKLQSVPGLGLGLSAANDVGRNEGDAVRLEER